MKRNVKAFFFSIAALLCGALLLAACGSGGAGGETAASEAARPASADNAYDYDYAEEATAEMGYTDVDAGEASAGAGLPVQRGDVSLSEKIIYSAEATVETLEFDAAIEKVYAMLERCDAFIETSYIDGSGGSDGGRFANFTLRVPRESFTNMTNSLSELGNLLSISSNAVNIQTQYTDAESRLTAYRTEEERLLSMLASVKDVESMIAIESRLSNVRYEIESLTSRMRDWDNQVNYSSVSLYIREVKQLRAQLQPGAGYTQELKEGFTATLRGVGAFFMELFKFVVIALPAIVLLAVVFFAVFFIVKRKRARRAKRADADAASRDGAAAVNSEKPVESLHTEGRGE